MEFEFLSQPFFDHEGKTKVIIQSSNPYTVLSARIDGDWRNRDKRDIVDAVLEYNHKLLFVDRAMAESVLKVEEMDNKIKEVDLAIASLKETEKRITEEAQVTQNTLMDVLDQMVEKGLIEV